MFYKVAKTGKSGKTEKVFPFWFFPIIFDGPRSLGKKTINISFSRAFERAMCHFDLNSDIKKGPLVVFVAYLTARLTQLGA